MGDQFGDIGGAPPKSLSEIPPKIARLTKPDAKFRNAKPKDKPYKRADELGIYLIAETRDELLRLRKDNMRLQVGRDVLANSLA